MNASSTGGAAAKEGAPRSVNWTECTAWPRTQLQHDGPEHTAAALQASASGFSTEEKLDGCYCLVFEARVTAADEDVVGVDDFNFQRKQHVKEENAGSGTQASQDSSGHRVAYTRPQWRELLIREMEAAGLIVRKFKSAPDDETPEGATKYFAIADAPLRRLAIEAERTVLKVKKQTRAREENNAFDRVLKRIDEQLHREFLYPWYNKAWMDAEMRRRREKLDFQRIANRRRVKSFASGENVNLVVDAAHIVRATYNRQDCTDRVKWLVQTASEHGPAGHLHVLGGISQVLEDPEPGLAKTFTVTYDTSGGRTYCYVDSEDVQVTVDAADVTLATICGRQERDCTAEVKDLVNSTAYGGTGRLHVKGGIHTVAAIGDPEPGVIKTFTLSCSNSRKVIVQGGGGINYVNSPLDVHDSDTVAGLKLKIEMTQEIPSPPAAMIMLNVIREDGTVYRLDAFTKRDCESETVIFDNSKSLKEVLNLAVPPNDGEGAPDITCLEVERVDQPPTLSFEKKPIFLLVHWANDSFAGEYDEFAAEKIQDPRLTNYFVKQTNFDLEWPGKSIYTKDHPLHEQSLADMPAQKAAAAAEIEASNLQTVAQRAARDAGEARARGDRDAAAKEAIAARAERDAASSNAAAQVVAKAAAETAVGETQQRLAAEQRFKGLFDFASCSAQKAKLLLSIMESPKESGGAGINFEEFGPEGSEILSDFFPLHGESELQLLRHRWAKWSLMFHDSFGSRKQLLDIDGSPMHDPSTNPPKPLLEVLPCRWNQPLDEIRDYFGVKIAFYFAFMGVYTTFIAIGGAVGLPVYCYIQLSDEPADQSSVLPFYAVFLCLWSVVLTEKWKRQQHGLASHWDVENLDVGSDARVQFVGEIRASQRMVGANGSYALERYEAWPVVHSCRLAFSAVVVLIAIMCVIIVLVSVIVFRGFVKHLSAEYGSAIGGTVNGVIIYVMNGAYKGVAIWLNEKENHRTTEQYDNALVLKTFLFQFFNSYVTLFYIAFFKPVAIAQGWEFPRIPYLPSGNSTTFDCKVDPTDANEPDDCLGELNAQLLSIFGMQLAIGNIQEVAIPALTRWQAARAANKKAKRTETNSTSSTAGLLAGDAEGEESSLERYESESISPKYESVFDDYNEMILQYGYIVFFSVSCPLVTVLAALNNFIEIRSDAYKLCYVYQRPPVLSASNIGCWQYIMHVMSYVAVLTNGGLIFFTSDVLESWFRVWFGDGDGEMFDKFGLTLLVTGFFLFEHAILLLSIIIDAMVPDTPIEVTDRRARAQYQALKLEQGKQEVLAPVDVSMPDAIIDVTDETYATADRKWEEIHTVNGRPRRQNLRIRGNLHASYGRRM